jgi:hypothetical protein
MSVDAEKLLVFGDSHAVIWEGSNVLQRRRDSLFKDVSVFHLGPALAFNLLNKEGTQLGKWGEQIFSHVAQALQQGNQIAGLMLCFGEIDIRTQVIKRAIAMQSSIEASVQTLADRMDVFSAMLYEKFGLPVLLWEPVPTSSSKNFTFNPNFPTVGTEVERNYATQCLAHLLRQLSADRRDAGQRIYSFGVFDELTQFYETKTQFFEDGCHLNLDGLEVAIRSLKTLCEAHQLGFSRFFDASTKVRQQAISCDVTDHIQVRLSSDMTGSAGLSTQEGTGYCFHTQKEQEPYALLDIGYAALMDKLIIHNRLDGYSERAKNMAVYVGNDLNSLGRIYASSKAWGSDGEPLVINFEKFPTPVRFILLKLADNEHFHLGAVNALVKRFQLSW